jgi:hypothetical protein
VEGSYLARLDPPGNATRSWLDLPPKSRTGASTWVHATLLENEWLACLPGSSFCVLALAPALGWRLLIRSCIHILWKDCGNVQGAVPACCLRRACSISCLCCAKLYGAAAHPVSPFFETESTNRGKEAPVFGSCDHLFLDPSSPKR